MTGARVLLACLLALTAAAGASASWWWPFGGSEEAAARFELEHVVKLTQENFEDRVVNVNPDSEKFSFVKFYAPWCAHCKSLAPVWGQLAAENTDGSIEFCQVDCTKNNKLCRKAAVRGFPEVKVFYKGQITLTRTGGGDLEGMRKFVAEALPTVRERHQKAQQEEAEKAAAAASSPAGTGDAGSTEL